MKNNIWKKDFSMVEYKKTEQKYDFYRSMDDMWKDLIKLSYQEMTRTQKQAADYILANENEIPNLTIRTFAVSAGVGQPTILRMLQKCGYASWSVFLKEIWKEHGREETLISIPIDGNEKYKSRHRAVIQSIGDDIHLISEMIGQLDLYQLDELVRKIKHAKIIDIYGTDNSANAATELAGRLLHLGLTSRNYSDLFFQKISAGHLGKKDVAIGFSISGETTAVIQALQFAKNSGALTVAITGDKESALANEADMVFLTPTIYHNEASKWIASRITQMAYVDALCAAIMNSDTHRFQEELKKSTKGFEEDVSKKAR